MMPILTSVVLIETGEVIEALVTETGIVWRQEHLRRDGQRNLRYLGDGQMTRPDSRFGPDLWKWATYASPREERANVIRTHIAALRVTIEEEERALCALYDERPGKTIFPEKGA
jgi:hypothetical protein